MHIAILMTGHFRTWPICWRSLLKTLGNTHTFDLFFHTYKERYNYHPYIMESLNIEPDVNKIVLEEDMISSIRQNNGVVEEEEPEVPNIDEYPTNLDIHCQIRKIRLCNELRQYNSKNSYDLVLRARPDILYSGTLIPENVRDGVIYIPPDECVGHLTDVCFFGSPDSMNRLIDALSRKYPEKIINPHLWLYKCVEDAGLTYQTVPTSNISVVRRLRADNGPNVHKAVPLTEGAVSGFI